MPHMARKPVMPDTMGQPRGFRQVASEKPVWGVKRPRRRPWLIILNLLGLFQSGQLRALLSFDRCCMRSISAILASVFVCASAPATADSRVFIIANQADVYCVDQCLAKSEKD